MQVGYKDSQANICDLYIAASALIMSTEYTDGRLTFEAVTDDDAGDEVLCRLHAPAFRYVASGET